ncbi:MAG: hypothetical protein CMH53_09260 [Myxococcales bacterium]|nr:hypothetical protein [Myxococcales bacterium]
MGLKSFERRRCAACLVVLIANLLASAISHATPLHVEPEELDRFSEVERQVRPPSARIRLDVACPQGRADVTQWELDALSWHYLHLLEEQGVRHLTLQGRVVGSEAPWVAMDQLLRALDPPAARAYERVLADSSSAAPLRAEPAVSGVSGVLSGKVIYLSPGHGWYWSDVLDRWATQRGNTHDIVEDFVNAEAAMHYLVPLLRNAGATVIGVRELDINAWMGLVDNGDGQSIEFKGPWNETPGAGFSGGIAPYKGNVNPFEKGSVHTVQVQKKASAVATWSFNVPSPGVYIIYIGYTAGSDRAQDAHFVIQSAAGARHVRVDQSRHGQTWTPLVQLYLDGSVQVELHNDSAGPADRLVVADVVRIGGGMGQIVRGDGAPPAKGPTSGRPRWEECSRYYAQFSGASPKVWNVSSGDSKDDVSTRARFAAWHHEVGEDALYISWHSNAGSGPARGTSTYVYGPNPPNGSKNYQGTSGSTELAKALQNHIVGDLRATWQSDWKDRGVYSAYFGEVNPKSNPEMPSALIECAFHSTKADADSLREPRFRLILSRAIRKAIIHYFAQRDQKEAKLPPSAPVSVELDSDGTLSWKPGPASEFEGDPATSYIVQTSTQGRHFGAGKAVKDQSIQLQMPTGNQPLFARVVAVNEAGVSLASTVVGASYGCDGVAEVLVVDAFTRLTASQMPTEELSIFALATVQRLRQRRMNTFDYAIEHVTALANAGHAVATTHRSAWLNASAGIQAQWLYWASGEQGLVDEVMNDQERAAVEQWLGEEQGRALLVTGAEFAWTLGKLGGVATQWMQTWLGTNIIDDDAGLYEVNSTATGPIEWQGGKLDDGTGPSYHIDWPDVLDATGGQALLVYGDSNAPDPQVAAVLHNSPQGQVITVGFPIEGLVTGRDTLIAQLSEVLDVNAEFTAGCPVPNAPDQVESSAELESVDAGSTASDDLGGLIDDDLNASQAESEQVDGGCGCDVRGRSRPSGAAALWLLLMLGLIVAHRKPARSASN